MTSNHRNPASAPGFAVLPFIPKAGLCILFTIYNGWFAFQAIRHWVAGTLDQIQADDGFDFVLGILGGAFICCAGVFLASEVVADMKEHQSGRPFRGAYVPKACIGICILSYLTSLAVYVYNWFFLRGATP
ncbi:MAG: hypothetical protein KDA29_02960 [Phycisphaerales bacterium]|nr:hypothetical protein [Phycisphaerales bacterium]